jgi:hypothetical protein
MPDTTTRDIRFLAPDGSRPGQKLTNLMVMDDLAVLGNHLSPNRGEDGTPADSPAVIRRPASLAYHVLVA